MVPDFLRADVKDVLIHKPGDLSPLRNSKEFLEGLFPKLYDGPGSRVNFSVGNPAFKPSPTLTAHLGQAALDGSNSLYRSSRGDKPILNVLAEYFRANGIAQAGTEHVMPGYG